MFRTSALAVLLITSLGSSPTIGAAQQTEAELLERLETLAPLVEEARAEYEAHRARIRQRERQALEAARLRQDTVQVGLMTIVARGGQGELARELFSEVWDDHFSGILESPGVEGTVFGFQWGPDQVRLHVEGRRQLIQFGQWVRRERVKDQISSAIAASLTYDWAVTNGPVAQWVNGDPHRNHDLGAIYRQLATSRSHSVRACLDGSSDACAVSLGLGVEEGDLEAWYTAEERRALVGRISLGNLPRAVANDSGTCIEERDQMACERVLERMGGIRLAPLPGSVRASLVSLALDRGGPGAWGRLLESPDLSTVEALEVAAGEPIETLVAEWREWVIDGRPAVYGDLGSTSGTTLLWTLFFAGLALRSTRWRMA